jgi:hypothetical protein
MPALARGYDDLVLADVRPGQPQQIAEPQPGMRSEIDGEADVGRTCFLDQDYIVLGPDDLRAVGSVELLDALGGISCNLAERIDCIG